MHGDVITKFIHSYNEYVLVKKKKINSLLKKMDRSEEQEVKRSVAVMSPGGSGEVKRSPDNLVGNKTACLWDWNGGYI